MSQRGKGLKLEDYLDMASYYNDIDPYCCKVLRKNIHNGNLPGGYVDERDIRTVRADDIMGYQHIHLFAGFGGFPLGLRWANFPESIRVLTGGFPCQDISESGRKEGIDGARSGLWSYMYRLICELRPDFVIVENVAALLHRGMSRVLGDLAAGGYDAEWQVLSAEAFGAPHLRERVFIVGYPVRIGRGRQGIQHNTGAFSGKRSQDDYEMANATSIGCRSRWTKSKRQFGQTWTDSTGTPISNTDRQRLEIGQVFGSYARQKLSTLKRGHSTGSGQWTVEPAICRLVNGLPFRVEQIRGYGNALIPQIAECIAYCIMAAVQANQEVAS